MFDVELKRPPTNDLKLRHELEFDCGPEARVLPMLLFVLLPLLMVFQGFPILRLLVLPLQKN